MAGADEGVRNLERFLGLLASATGELSRLTEHLEQREEGLARCTDEAGDEGGGLNDDVHDLAAAIASEAEDARDGVADLRATADDAAEVLDGARAVLDDAVAVVEERTAAAANVLDEGHARVDDRGFQPLGRTVAALEPTWTEATAETARTTDETDAAIGTMEEASGAAWSAADGAIDQILSGVDRIVQGCEAGAASAREGFALTGDALESTCDSVEGELVAIYDALSEGADAEQHALSEGLRGAAQLAVASVEAGLDESVVRAGDAVVGEALPALGLEQTRLAAALAAASVQLDPLPRLADDLIRCRAVIAQIDALLQAMTG